MSEHVRSLELAAASIDFELSPSEAAELTAHLAACDGCRRIAGALHADARALRRLSEGVPTERVRREVLSGAPRRRLSPLFALGVAAALVVAVVGGLSAGAALRTTREKVPSEAPTWTRLSGSDAFPAGEGRSTVLALAAVHAVGTVDLAAVGTGSGAGRVWLSSDAVHWSLIADSSELARARPTAIGAMGGRIVIVGSTIDEAGAPAAAAWTSTDARTWSHAALSGSTGLLAVAASPARIVVAGAGRTGSGLPIWMSRDGRSWTPASQTTAYSMATVTGLTVGGPGFVAVGYDDRGAVIWTSPDAMAWTRVDDASFTSSRMTAVATTPAGLVAVGFDARGPVAWSSLDGVAWIRAERFGSADDRPTAVAATPFGVIAIGHSSSGALAWLSTDGRTWEPESDGAWSGADLTAVVAHGSTVVAAGAADGTAGVWLGTGTQATP